MYLIRKTLDVVEMMQDKILKYRRYPFESEIV